MVHLNINEIWEKNEKIRINRALHGHSPCKRPYCTGKRCYRNPFICHPWEIYNDFRKRLGK